MELLNPPLVLLLANHHPLVGVEVLQHFFSVCFLNPLHLPHIPHCISALSGKHLWQVFGIYSTAFLQLLFHFVQVG